MGTRTAEKAGSTREVGVRKTESGYRSDTSNIPATPRRTHTVARTPYSVKRTIGKYAAETDPITTYLRLKPASASMLEGEAMPGSVLQVVSDKEVEMGGSRYLFSGVLPGQTAQARVYEVCGAPVVRDLFRGYNTLLFAYGVTNSGKTHTVQGHGQDPGVLARSVAAVLHEVDRLNAHGDLAIRPKYATQVEFCSDARVSAPVFRAAPGEDAWVEALQGPPALGEQPGDWIYQLYVTYVEIHNETVYDLLDLTTLTAVPGARRRRRRGDDPQAMSGKQIASRQRAPLLVRAEGQEAFVEGATAVRVRTTRDLARVLIHGQLRRAVHATGANAGSSRSHVLLQARLVKAQRTATAGPLGVAGARASVRTLTVVDLAGSERVRRTQAQGARLAEAGKINTSLMTLKKCLDVKRFNAQRAPGEPPALVPYNESKVTRLLQPALEGGARTVMVVCVDPYDAGDTDVATETRSVLDFAQVASALVAHVRRVEDPPEENAGVDGSKRTAARDAGPSAKRVRADLGGAYRDPSSVLPSTPATPSRRAAKPVVPSTPTGEWRAMTQGAQFGFSRTDPRELAALVDYAAALQTAYDGLRSEHTAALERLASVEAETRQEACEFFVARISELQNAWRQRLSEEVRRGEAKAAHKLDILSRVRAPHMPSAEELEDALSAAIGQTDAAQTVSPRTALRRAVSRAQSKRANKVTSVSAGESTEIVRLRSRIDALDAQCAAQRAQLDLANQARAAERMARDALQHALQDARADHARHPAHVQERAELLAQAAMLKGQLRDAESHAARARRQWETQELLPVQERLRQLISARQAVTDAMPDELLQHACRERDDAFAWWSREQERNSQLSAQNDVLMREIRRLQAQVRGSELTDALPASTGLETQVRASTPSDSEDGSFCKVSLKSINSIEAINGGNPLGAHAMPEPKPSALQRHVPSRHFASTESFAPSDQSMLSSRFEQKAKRVVSRVFQHLAPESRRNRSHSIRRLGNYSAEVLSFEGGLRTLAEDAPGSMSHADLRSPKVRSVVYSGPIVAQPTGGVSVTFTSQEVHDLPIDPAVAGSISDAEPPSPQGSKRSRKSEIPPDDVPMADDVPMPTVSQTPSSRPPSGKKKRRLRANRTVLSVDPENSDFEDDAISTLNAKSPAAARPPPARAAAAAVPEENKQPVLYTPIRARSRSTARQSSSHHHLPLPHVHHDDNDDKNESFFLTPMKMLSRLRNKKK